MLIRYLIVLILPFVISCKAIKDLQEMPKVQVEDGYEIAMTFKPDSEYVTTLSQVTSTNMSMPSMPEQSSVTEATSVSTITFGPDKDGVSDMLIVYDKMDMQVTGVGADQVQKPEIAGTKIYGKLSQGVQSIDSIVGGDSSVNGMIKQMIEPMFNNLKVEFPNPMKVGDSFVDIKVVDIPTEGVGTASITTETTYTLVKVADNIADFTTQIKLTGLINIMDQEIPIEGTGGGTMVVDIVNSYSTSSSTVIDQKMVMDMQGMMMEQNVSVSVTTETEKVK